MKAENRSREDKNQSSTASTYQISQNMNNQDSKQEKKKSQDEVEEQKKVKTMIIKNLIDFIACNLDKKLSQIEHMVEKNNKNFKKA